MVVKAGEPLLQMLVGNRSDSLAQLVQSDIGLGCTVCRVEARPQLPAKAAEPVAKPLIHFFQLCHGLRLLRRDMAGVLEKAPTPRPPCWGQFQAVLIVLCFPIRLQLPAGGYQGLIEVPPEILDRMAMVGLPAGLRLDRLDGVREALRVV